MEENIIPGALVDDAQLTSAAAEGTVEKVITDNVDTLSLSELNQFLGKDFKTKDSALKAVKDTFSYVGKKKEDIEREVLAKVSNDTKTDSLSKELEQMRIERFFDKNPDLAPFQAAYEKVGGSPSEFFNSEVFKPIFEAAKGYNESQKLKTVLESNPRLASTRDAFSKAKELQAQGANKDEVEQLIVRGVLDSMSK